MPGQGQSLLDSHYGTRDARRHSSESGCPRLPQSRFQPCRRRAFGSSRRLWHAFHKADPWYGRHRVGSAADTRESSMPKLAKCNGRKKILKQLSDGSSRRWKQPPAWQPWRGRPILSPPPRVSLQLLPLRRALLLELRSQPQSAARKTEQDQPRSTWLSLKPTSVRVLRRLHSRCYWGCAPWPPWTHTGSWTDRLAWAHLPPLEAGGKQSDRLYGIDSSREGAGHRRSCAQAGLPSSPFEG